jgi:hypothetical protein
MLGETEEVASSITPLPKTGKMAAPGQLAAIDLRKEEEWEGEGGGGLWRGGGRGSDGGRGMREGDGNGRRRGVI